MEPRQVLSVFTHKGKDKGKVHPRIGHEDT